LVTCARAHLNKISAMTTVYDFTAQDITGATIPLRTYQGKVLLIVNTASKCGFTPQYEGLQRRQKDLADRGFAVLGFHATSLAARSRETPSKSRVSASSPTM
jgi:glutathione peroxidase-family protein